MMDRSTRTLLTRPSLVRGLNLAVMAALLLIGSLGCQTVPKEQLAHADHGKFPAAYQHRIKQFFNVNEHEYAGYIKPDWRFEEPFKAAFKESKSETWRFGYGVEMRFNRKRELQGYAPNERHVFFFHENDMWPVNLGDTLRKIE